MGNVEAQIPQIPLRYFLENSDSNETLRSAGEWRDIEELYYTPSEAYTNWLRDTTGINVSPLTKYYNNEGVLCEDFKGAYHVRIASVRDEALFEDIQARVDQLSI